MRTVFSLLFLMSVISVHAQKQTFDLISFTAPAGWKKQATEQSLQLMTEDTAKGTYCIMMLFKALPGGKDAKANFDAAWETVVKGMVTISAPPEMQPAAIEDGWEAQSGYASYQLEGTQGVAILATSTGFDKMVNILVLTNTDAYQTEMAAFFESVKLSKPAGGSTPVSNTQTNTQPVTATNNDGYTYSTTNFNDGWTSTIHKDYVLTTKGDIQVYLSYVEKFNISDFSGTGKQVRFHYWDTYVAKYFVTGEKKFDSRGVLSDYSQDYMEGWATDRQSGAKRYIAMLVRIIPYTGTLSIIIASAASSESLRSQFPKADARFDNDLAPMYGYNKFAVGKKDLTGTWSSGGNGASANWYSTVTGNQVGSTAVATSDVFHFSGGTSYSSTHKGASGWVGAMNIYQQEYKGTFTVTDWTVTATNRFNGKTVKFDAWFEIVNGGRILHLLEGAMETTLFKGE